MVEEKEVGRDSWVFDRMYDTPTKDIPTEEIAKAKSNVPWIDGKSYTLEVDRDAWGKARKLIYTLQNGKKIILEDRNGNCIADRITEEN